MRAIVRITTINPFPGGGPSLCTSDEDKDFESPLSHSGHQCGFSRSPLPTDATRRI